MAFIAVLLAFAAGTIYVTRLAFAPVYLVHDEVQFGRQAASLHSAGRDLAGRRWPLYFAEPGFSIGRDPVLIYATAIVLSVLPLSEFSVRLPTALVGVLNVVLMFLLARRLFRREWLGLVAAALLAWTPAHFLHSRLGVSLIVPLPFVLTWLLCLAAFVEDGSPWSLGAAACALGLGVYSYLGSIVLTPIYLAGTAVLVHARYSGRLFERSAVRGYVVVLIAFLVPLVPFVAWEIVHPRYAELVRYYRPYGHPFEQSREVASTAWQGLQQTVSAVGVGAHVSAYWAGLSPNLLFISGEASLINGTRSAGAFLWPLAFLIPVGVYAIFTDRRSPFTLLLLVGFFTSPLSGAITTDSGIRRALVMLPFGALIATYGVERLSRNRRVAWRAAGVVLLLLVPISFRSFYLDYMGDNRIRSAPWHGGNVKDALEAAIERQRGLAGPVYLSRQIQYIDEYWDFYLLSRGRADLVASTIYFDGEEVGEAPVGALLVSLAGAPPSPDTLSSTGWAQVATSREPDGSVSHLVFEKIRQ